MFALSSTYHAVVDDLPLVLDGHEGLADAAEVRLVVKATHLVPGRRGEPGGRVAVGVLESDPARQQEPPLSIIHLLVVFQDVDAEYEGEEEL